MLVGWCGLWVGVALVLSAASMQSRSHAPWGIGVVMHYCAILQGNGGHDLAVTAQPKQVRPLFTAEHASQRALRQKGPTVFHNDSICAHGTRPVSYNLVHVGSRAPRTRRFIFVFWCGVHARKLRCFHCLQVQKDKFTFPKPEPKPKPTPGQKQGGNDTKEERDTKERDEKEKMVQRDMEVRPLS